MDVEGEGEDLSDIFGSENIMSTPQTFTRLAAPDPERGAVMVEWPRTADAGYRPNAEVRDSWDDRHLRMPFSKVAASC